MDTETVQLTASDYQMLHAMLMSDDEGQRAQAAGLASKLTPDEHKAFFDYQKDANKGKGERTREDNSILGMPPELAVLSGVGVGRAVVGAASGAVSRAAAGAKAVVAQATPVVKYEATKAALEHMGVPSPLATAAAMMIAGYKKGAKAEPAIAAAEPVAAPAASAPGAPAPVAAAPAPGAPPVPQAAPPSPQSGIAAPSPGPSPAAAALPDQRALNEAALAARRAAYQARMQSAPPPVEAPAAVAPAAGNVKLSGAETKAFLDLMKRGMSGSDAMKNVLMQRELVASLGTPAPTAAQTRFPKGMRGKVTP